MQIGLNISIASARATVPPVITATSAPSMVVVDDTETPADGYTAGSYASSEGTISSAVATYLVNGASEASSYDLSAGDTVRVRVLVTDSEGNTRTFNTAQVITTPSVALSNSAIPVISGTANVGQTLSVTDGTWAGSASRTFSYQWTRDGSDISGATASTYTLVAADDETDLGCTVTADDGFTQVSASATAVSVTYAAPSAAAGLSDQSYDEDTGVQTVDASGDFTGAVGGTWSVSGASATINQSGVVSIPTATAIGATTVTVTYTNSGGSDSSAFSVTVTAPDTTAPVLTSPTNAAATFETSTWGVSTDEGNGTLYWVISTSGTAPTAAQVKAGQNNSGASAVDSGSASVSGTGSQTGAGSGLTAETAYYTHFMHEDTSGNQSSVASATSFTTPSSFDPATLFTGGREGVALDTANSFTDTAGTTAATTGDDIARINDLSGNDNHVTQAVVAERPELTADGSMDFDGVDDNLTLLSSGLGSDMTIAMALKASPHTLWALYNAASSKAGLLAEDGNAVANYENSIAGFPTTLVDGVEPSNRDELHDAIMTGSWVYLTVSSGNFSTWGEILFGDRAGREFDGELGPRILIIDRDLTTVEQTDVKSWVMEGLT
jgi:hypothetical protein